MPIRRGDWDDEECMGALLSVSFVDDPFVRWLLPKSRDFLLDSKKHPRRAYSAAFDAGTVYVIGDFAGAAVWLPPGAKKDRSEAIAQTETSVATESQIFPPEFQALVSQSAAYCPSDPHWYLGLIAVDPAYRGHGVGTKLLEYCLAVVDRDGLPAYLESTNKANRSLYRRFGFQELAEVRVGLSPPRFPMLRPARKQNV
ncbi:GNAT family N-acetyltransferase [Pseudohalocynthiibacter aestuariivivens]|uniref:GNAT family N-acetyltransferase n=1 Tax=Pseudohalocynthiibacter aestuariivivens TaxID=1591409 RepID=A0ABV5JF11_9RHOB|nr:MULTISPECIES: GNAT family N-acetyltransferase [Pseudohalocynthiibacter]MBS9718861.1 GNAT family N-acetyltransferase [Pseudohalocynthiibacter aestuariivivens]MCK0103315.1 GNAT family N-acetyltransferase [Pseudohalocynthiibacter sp. F2068]